MGLVLLGEPRGARSSPFGLVLPVGDLLAAVRGEPPELASGPPDRYERCRSGADQYPREHREAGHFRLASGPRPPVDHRA